MDDAYYPHAELEKPDWSQFYPGAKDELLPDMLEPRGKPVQITMLDNMRVVKNTSVPESQLKKKSNSIAYHFVRQQVAADVGRIFYEPTDTNLADMLTKVQTGTNRNELARHVMF
jgi:hypothetical protein